MCLARRGVGPFARKGDARRNELRAVFALFDVESRGAISLMDVRNAVKRGGAGLSEADAGDWPKLAEALEAKIRGIAAGEIGFEAFARIVEGALRRDEDGGNAKIAPGTAGRGAQRRLALRVVSIPRDGRCAGRVYRRRARAPSATRGARGRTHG